MHQQKFLVVSVLSIISFDQQHSISYGYAAIAQYLSVIASIELMLFVLLL